MSQITLVWAALGLLVGAFGWLAGARSAYPRGGGRWAAFARWILPLGVAALAAVAGGWISTLVVGKLAATSAALGVAAAATFLISLISHRSVTTNNHATNAVPTSF